MPAKANQADTALITAPSTVPAKPDKYTKDELSEEHNIRNLLLRQLLGHRRWYALGIFLLVILWLVGIFLLLVWQGFTWRGFHLSDSVLLAAIGSTTANIIGVLLIIVKFIFSDATQRVPPRTRTKP
jgi:hypothetical protein